MTDEDDVGADLDAQLADQHLQSMVATVVTELGESAEAVRGARVIASILAMLTAGQDAVGLDAEDAQATLLLFLIALARALDQLP